MSKIFIVFLMFFCFTNYAQIFIGNSGVISFFSETPIEDISAINKKVSAVFDASTNDLVFQLEISDFNFPIPLMQEHFNENYLESDLFPISNFIGKVVENNDGNAQVSGQLTIHGVTKNINVYGIMNNNKGLVEITSEFSVKLEDFNIKIPKIVMYKIADVIQINVNIKLKEVI